MQSAGILVFVRALRPLLRLIAMGGPALLLPPVGRAGNEPVVAVYSSVSPAYQRATLPDGTRKPETYAFGEGGDVGGPTKDATIDRLRFIDIARLIAPSLAKEAYLPCDPKAPDQTQILVMVYWGRTVGTDRTSSSAQYQIAQALQPPPPPPMSLPPDGNVNVAMVSDPSASGRMSEGQGLAAIKSANDGALQQSLLLTALANRQRDKQDVDNAAVTGFLNELKDVQHYEMSAFALRRRDVLDEVEESRYFVVLMAYDFQLLRRQKQRKLLWETRFSIPERRNNFGKQLAAMADTASRFYGQDSQGLKRKPMGEGQVKLDELKILGAEPEKP